MNNLGFNNVSRINNNINGFNNNMRTINNNIPVIDFGQKKIIENGWMKLNDGSILEGTFVNGQLCDEGKVTKNGVLIYEGQFLKNQYCGEGTLYYDNGCMWYEGEFSKNLFNGTGRLYCDNGKLYYRGRFLNGRMHGEGELFGDNGIRYIGNCFSNGFIRGYGRKIYANGVEHEGYIYDGVINGYVKVHLSNGNYYTSNCINNSIQGKSYLYSKDHRLLEAADLKNDVFNGNGIEYKWNGNILERHEYVAVNGQKTYNGVSINQSVYWDIIHSPFIKVNDKKVINEKQTHELVIDTLRYKAKEEIDIISPWLGEWTTKEDEFVNAIRSALNRGIKIKIITGIGDDESKNKRRTRTLANMNYLKTMFFMYKNLLSFEIKNTHEKMVLCDEDYMLIGSQNVLSYNPNGKNVWSESMTYITNPDTIRANRNDNFSF